MHPRRARHLLALALAGGLAACGGSSDAGGTTGGTGGNGGTGGTSGAAACSNVMESCQIISEVRPTPYLSQCIDYTTGGHQAQCVGAVYSTSACPTAERVGTCVVQYGSNPPGCTRFYVWPGASASDRATAAALGQMTCGGTWVAD